jgi:hypothetical protein
MSTRRPVAKTPEPELPEEDEDEEIDLGDEEEDEMDTQMDMMDALGSMLTTEEGDTIATALVSLKDATERIADTLEMQNKILVKILSTLKVTQTPKEEV